MQEEAGKVEVEAGVEVEVGVGVEVEVEVEVEVKVEGMLLKVEGAGKAKFVGISFE